MTNICPNTIYKVTNIKRCNNTAAGNPVYEITLNGHTTLKTKANIMDAYKVHYGMTKTAQLAISRGLAESCAGTGVTVNSVLPGPTSSEGVSEFVDKLSGGQSFESFEKTFFEEARPSSLLKRFTKPEEVANLVVYVCSQASSATTGAALRADGGVVRSAF